MRIKEKIAKKFKESSLKKTSSVFGIVSLLILLAYVISLLVPLGWAFTTSFRDALDFRIQGAWHLPEPWINNYKVVFDYFQAKVVSGASFRMVKIPEMVFNSIVYALGGACVSTLTALLVAYVVAKFDFKYCKVIYVAIILQMIIPIVGSLPSELKMARDLGLYDKLLGMWVMKTHVSGLYFLVFYASFKQIPKTYTEAAELDGAGEFTVMVRIIFPFVKGSIFTVILLQFISLWNDYQTPLLYMPTHPTIAYGLQLFTGGAFEAATANVPMKLAGCILVAVPLLIVFVVFQKRLLGDITVGGLK